MIKGKFGNDPLLNTKNDARKYAIRLGCNCVSSNIIFTFFLNLRDN